MSLTPELVRPFPKATGRKGTANSTRKKRGTAILTDTPVKAALQDKQKSRQVAKGKTHQTGSRKSLCNNPARDSKKKKIVRKIQTKCSDENGGETCLVCMDRYSKSVAGENGFNLPSAKCGPMKNTQLAFPGDIFVATASRMYQMKISEFLWTYISVLSIIFQYNL
jgi:hypothetical protein